MVLGLAKEIICVIFYITTVDKQTSF